MDRDLEQRYEELEARLKIDQMNLDAELIGHPHDYWHAAKGATEAISIRDKAKDIHDRYAANLNMIFRREAHERKERITEAQLDMMILSDQDCIDMWNQYLQYKKEADLWVGLRDSFIQKGYALKSLIDVLRSDQIAAYSYAEQRKDAFANYKKPG